MRESWFTRASTTTPLCVSNSHNLLFEAKLSKQHFETLRSSALSYLSESTEYTIPFDTTTSKISDTDIAALSNRTPNGIILPKSELEGAFAVFHSSLIDCFKSLEIAEMFHSVALPPTLRVVQGKPAQNTTARPYSASTIHCDLWGGDPADSVMIFIPIAGDIENTTIEFFQPPENFEEDLLKRFDDYAQAANLLGDCKTYPLKLKAGHIYLVDAIVPHRTIRIAKNNAAPRISAEIRLRRKCPLSYHKKFEKECEQGRLTNFVDLSTWYELQKSKRMYFFDTLKDAKSGLFRKDIHNSKSFEIV